uniref:Uncharacterized protein LOC104210240 n=1 Tax=Nicotiana sylvestris TaxID=4096 RepID=A0A1U7UT52_NICSY|nr:PREDICTED: uncharacterized protein LOC104210240 [Nicotiana sylvestris]
MENENKALHDQMKEHQERVDKIPGAPKLLLKQDIYDGTTDPEDHIVHYVIAIKDNNLSKELVPSVLLKKFGETLTGGALTWYSQQPARSIATLEEMADKFITAHAGAKKAKARVNDIFVVRQTPGEGLRDFLARFNKVRMSLPNVSKGMVVAAFQNGLSRNGSRATRKLVSRLMKYPPTTWEEIYNAYCTECILEKLDTKVQWPQNMKSNPSTRKSNALCKFHQERGHKIEDCIGLRQEVVRMLNQGHLRELMSDRGRANFARGREQP